MKIEGMPIQWIAIILIVFFGLFRISIAASHGEDYEIHTEAEPSLSESIFPPGVPSNTHSIMGENDFSIKLGQYDVVVAYFCGKYRAEHVIHDLQEIINTKNGTVKLFLVDLIPANQPLFTKYGLKFDTKKDTILVFKGQEWRNQDKYENVTSHGKLKTIVDSLLYSSYIQTAAHYDNFLNETSKVYMIFDDGNNESKVRQIRNKIVESEGSAAFVGIVYPYMLGTLELLREKYDVWEFPTVFKYENGVKKKSTTCTSSLSSCWCIT